nr:retrovirus-related Pol polyprotein from transposon TNT 1-94 [Tanacetum cinerariifolium]GEW78823.1 retrovirus-related Pol polyprotein from transposon TNT 1-94 [Tanacetum cinerariifolium]
MITLAEFIMITGADNRPSMLEKSLYDSWKSRMELYIENQEDGRIILNSFQNGPLVWPTVVEEDGRETLEGVDLVSGSRDTNLYTISLDDMLKTSLICLLSKASKTKSWLWHCQLSHLNFGTLNKLAKDGLARGIPKLIFLKKYILVIVDDYSRFTWVKFLRSKDEAPDAIIKCIKNIQVCLNATVPNVRTYNGTEFVNQTLREFYENLGILIQHLLLELLNSTALSKDETEL